MPPVLNGFFKLLFLYIEPILTLGGAYSAFTTPEWYLTNLTPGPTITGLLHTTETNMAIRLYGVLLFLLAIISISIFSLIASHTDALSISVAKRLLFVLAVGDLVHLYVTVIHLGWETCLDVKGWNDMTWGNIGITLVLFLSRSAWFVFAGKGENERKVR